ncbi:hypothetical protein M080_4208, partial [Bacteroides fragilis str. 3397 T10]
MCCGGNAKRILGDTPPISGRLSSRSIKYAILSDS